MLSVTLSNLPPTATIKDVSLFCARAGSIATHPVTGEELILLNSKKATATVTYDYHAGAACAVKILNGEIMGDENRVTVKMAEKDPDDLKSWLKERRKYHAYVGSHEEELNPSEAKKQKIMVIKGVFKPRDLVEDFNLYNVIVQDITKICSEYGKVTLVKPIENNPLGVVLVRFDEPKSVALCIADVDGASYKEHKLSAEPWDGTNFAYRESEESERRRIELFGKFLC